MFRFCGVSVVILLLTSFQLTAQETATKETNAPGIKWYQLNTPHFRVLYPQGFDFQAKRVANNLETIREPEAKSMGVLPRKISVILHNNSSLSNGFVTVAPRRSELYTMPPQNYNFAGTNDWLNLLSSHEYRHIVQFQRSLTGFNKALYYVFGQQASAGMAFAAVPQWFWEGDAVATETAFTESGRGRIPNFDMVFRTNIMEGRTFNYHKQYLRSFKHNIPDHYVLGYNMISYLRKKTDDPMIWEKVVRRSWNVPFIPFAFSNAIKKETGLHVTDLFNEMAMERKKDYENALKDIRLTPFETLTHRESEAYTDYSFPQVLENGKILVTRTGIGDIDQLMVYSSQWEESDKHTQGFVNSSGMLSAAGNRVVWNEYRYDPRWLARTYSVIRGYDLQTGKEQKITSHSRYSAAALSPDGDQIATIETTVNYQTKIVILNYSDGKVVRELPNPDNDLIAMPRWTLDGKSLVVLRTNSKGKTISLINVTDGTNKNLLPFSQENVGAPTPFGRYILFNSPISGIDNIYAIDIENNQRFQVTSSKYGAFNPTVSRDGRFIYYNDQTRNGLDVVRAAFDPAAWKQPVLKSESNLSFEHLVSQEATTGIFNRVSDSAFSSKRYRRASGMINPHSWGPYFINELTNVRLGVASQDILSTTAIDAGYIHDINERTGGFQASVSYQGQFPVLSASVSKLNRSVNEGNLQTLIITGNNRSVITRNATFKWEELNVEGGVRIPLRSLGPKYMGTLSIGNYVGVTSVSGFTNSINNDRIIPSEIRNDTIVDGYSFYGYVKNGKLIYNHFSLTASHMLKLSRRDINSQWGQAIYVNAYNTPYGGDFTGSQFSTYGALYFPSFAKHHSIWGYGGYQKSELLPTSRTSDNRSFVDNAQYIFSNGIPLPRGQSISRFQNFYTGSANYTLPLWYPDIAIGPLVNIQRVRGNAFFDYGYGTTQYPGRAMFTGTYQSVGAEVRFDINVLRFLPQFNVGFRYTYGTTSFNSGFSSSGTRFEVLIGAINF